MKKLSFIIILLIVFLLGFKASTIAEYAYKSIIVEYYNIKINVNGNRIYPKIEPFIYNGRTLVPIRVISESLNKEVLWDDITKTIDIYDKKIVEPEKPNTFQVKEVIDGDTIRLMDGTVVRYIGINTPEKGQNYYEEAKAFNSLLVNNKNIRLEFDVDKTDLYGRSLAYVYIDEVFINLELIKAGLAVVYTVPPNVKFVDIFIAAQKEAQDKGIGIWKKSEVNLKITEINYDADGDDRENLNGEWITISNYSSYDIDMTGFKIMDEANHVYIFPTFNLKSNTSVKIYTGNGTNTISELYWRSNSPIWNNDRDTAFLYDINGKIIDTKSYP